MTITSQDYAALADDAYADRKVGRRDAGQEEKVYLSGNQYKIREHVNDPRTGYQGTIYQRVDSKEIVVAHRGTAELIKDGVLTDAPMVLARSNPQAVQAITLTQRAVDEAKRLSDNAGRDILVTVTGHSLGGSLAQITAHHHGLKGETFNAYGAVSLSGYRIPEGGHSVINHVMAADAVSAASPHFGEVRVYARQQEIDTLSKAQYSNSALNLLIPDYPLVAATASLDSHKMGQFLGDQSVLATGRARMLADDNARMIGEYRSDIEGLRTGATVISRGVPGGVMDAYDKMRGPLEPGEPGRRDTEQHRNDQSSSRMDEAGHPGYSLFQDARRGVHSQDARVGRVPDHASDQLAGSLATEMHAAGGTRIDAVLMSGDAARTFAVQGKVDDPAHLRVSVDTVVAMNTPLEQSSRQMEATAASQQLEQQNRQLTESQAATRSMTA
ncbi:MULTISPECIES: XVIPCD domain-containing protein [Stenotrophomonas]|uniref:XVIPCD domain-containing protein n=1 Tax=Stenotrophomonas TaxID=40323 RepID=UPI00201CD0CA|nr:MULTISPECIES: XVIPCD domain-containing protein [Stenotrophomonas]MDQ1062339.1 pimeloyl-ACP methyl ester carboxylesterase [Stenotrophomonas sp. SORGH_AS_0282]MDQ1189304.1 pimeloyl-ACP methyl ester carboxylesterase [Stenotrophomonas sp. SORGH_AS_0282]UQY86146.1 lipase [Stenotrophomonas rhizophila]